MANVMFKKGLLANLPSTYAEGTFYVTTDERAIYLDVSDETRIRLGDFQEFETLAALKANTNPNTSALYYIADVNCLAKWNGTDYIQINLDTGATSIDVAGGGNAITSAAYDPATRKITLTKGATYTTYDDVKQYVDDKTADIATDTALNELQDKIGEVPSDKTVVQMISDAQTAATYNDTQVKADIKSNADAIALLNDSSTVTGSVDYKIAQAVAAIMENPDETMNSINELVTWCNNHAKDALELNNKVSTNTTDIAALEALIGETGVAQQITDAINAALKIEGVDKYALATDLTSAIARIVALETKAHEHTNKDVIDKITAKKVSVWDASEQNAKDYADGLAVNYDVAGSASTAEANAKAYADSLVTSWGSF